MSQFVLTRDPIEASRHRVVALWFGDVDRIALESDDRFTGSAIVVAIYTLTGKYRYYVVFVALDQSIAEMWHITPMETSLADAATTQCEILGLLKNKGIVVNAIASENRHFQRVLSMLPLAYGDDTSASEAFQIPNAHKTSDGLSEDEKKALRDCFILF